MQTFSFFSFFFFCYGSSFSWFPLRGCSPRAGSTLLTRPASFVPHGAGRGAPVVFALCAHPIPKWRGQASTSTNGIVRPQGNTAVASWRSAGIIPYCRDHGVLLHPRFSVCVTGLISCFSHCGLFKPPAHSLKKKKKSFIPIISQHWQQAFLGLYLFEPCQWKEGTFLMVLSHCLKPISTTV